MNRVEQSLPLENFIQAVTSQLDRAQETMALKAKAGLPLTFAVRDLTLELRTHVEVVNSVVHIRPAGPGDSESSTLRLDLTTITRPMIEENTRTLELEPDEPPLEDMFAGGELSEDEQRRLEWAGIRSVGQLRQIEQEAGESTLRRVAQLPVARLRAALDRAAQPYVSRVIPDVRHPGEPSAPPLLRIRGRNLVGSAVPRVRIAGEEASVLEARDDELVVQPLAYHEGDEVLVETGGGESVVLMGNTERTAPTDDADESVV